MACLHQVVQLCLITIGVSVYARRFHLSELPPAPATAKAAVEDDDRSGLTQPLLSAVDNTAGAFVTAGSNSINSAKVGCLAAVGAVTRRNRFRCRSRG